MKDAKPGRRRDENGRVLSVFAVIGAQLAAHPMTAAAAFFASEGVRMVAGMFRRKNPRGSHPEDSHSADLRPTSAAGSRGEWPHDWDDLVRGIGCPMCSGERPESDDYGVRIRKAERTDAYLQRADIQRGYTLVIWRGRHVTEPTELSETEARDYWHDVLTVARALMTYYEPLKMNYETLGNSLPHLHTHLIPRYKADRAPGRPFPLGRQEGSVPRVSEERLKAEATALRRLLTSHPDR